MLKEYREHKDYKVVREYKDQLELFKVSRGLKVYKELLVHKVLKELKVYRDKLVSKVTKELKVYRDFKVYRV